MSRKNKYAIFYCLLMVTFVLAGCGNNQTSGNTSDTSSAGQTSEQQSSYQASGNAPSGSQTDTDQQQTGQQPADQASADQQQPTDQASADQQQPADQASANQQQPSDQASAGQQQQTGQTPASQQPTGQASASQPPAGQQPTGQTPAASGQITLEEARNLALNHAGLASSNVTINKEETDYDDGRLEYEIEFVTATDRYEYEVSSNGTILKSFKEPIEQVSPNLTEGYITSEAAKTAALNHAKLPQDQVTYSKVELEYDDGIMVYEIELYYGGVEYSFEINASSGAVLEMDID